MLLGILFFNLKNPGGLTLSLVNDFILLNLKTDARSQLSGDHLELMKSKTIYNELDGFNIIS